MAIRKTKKSTLNKAENSILTLLKLFKLSSSLFFVVFLVSTYFVKLQPEEKNGFCVLSEKVKLSTQKGNIIALKFLF